MITIGELDRRIMIQQGEASISTDFGEATQEWSDLRTVYAKYFVKGGKIEDESDQQVGLNNAYFIIRDPKFSSTPTFNEYDYRIKYDSKLYIIQNIRPIENRINDFLEVKTIEKSNTTA